MKTQSRNAFTLIELLVVIAIIVILASLLLPALARAKAQAQVTRDLNNKKQMQVAFQMYANDFGDKLVWNQDYYDYGANSADWCYAKMTWDNAGQNTNVYTDFLDPRTSMFSSYIARQTLLFWCPSDTFLSGVQRGLGWDHRCRSVCMNAAVGGGKKWQAFVTGWKGYVDVAKMNDFRYPPPSQAWVFMDEHPDSIDDAQLYVNPSETNGTGTFTELPAAYHGGACGLSFADGHAEAHKWRDTTQVKWNITYTQYYQNVAVTADVDLAWLVARTPRLSQ